MVFFEDKEDLSILYNDNLEIFSEVKKVFNEPKFKEYCYNKTNDNFYLFQFLYLDLFKDPSLLKENGILLEDIFKEYDIIRDKIIDGIDQTYLSGENYIIIDIEKTTCKSDLYYNSKICEKDNFMVFIYPLINKFKYLNKDHIESEYFIELELYYSMTFVDSNYNFFP